jgi:hypothetical protein
MGDGLMASVSDRAPGCDVDKAEDVTGFSWARTFAAQGASWVAPDRYAYFDGDISSLADDGKLDVVSRRGMASPYEIVSYTARNRYAFWRSWNHISGNPENIVVLRYVQSGVFSLTQCGATMVVHAGQFVFSRCNVPFRWESLSNDQTLTECVSILLPPDVVHPHFPNGVPLRHCLSSRADRQLAMPSILSLLNERGQAGRYHRRC